MQMAFDLVNEYLYYKSLSKGSCVDHTLYQMIFNDMMARDDVSVELVDVSIPQWSWNR